VKKTATWKRVLLGLGALLLLTVLGLALAAWLYVRKQRGQEAAALQGAQEARLRVSLLCDAVAEHQAETGTYLAAGPAPAQVPRGQAAPFPGDTAFAQLGFDPGPTTRYQYEVSVQETPVGDAEVVCIARGDLDGDGQVSVLRVTLDANGMKSPVKAEREEE
jgi:hypothetical protein